MTIETEQLERQSRLLQAAHQVGKQVTQSLNLDELLPKTVDMICEVYNFYYAGVFLIDETGQWAVLRAGYGKAGRAMMAEGHRLAVGGHSMIGWATGQRKARIALDVGEEKVHFKNPHLPLTRSEMALPLIVGDQVLGAVTIQSKEPNAFSEQDILTLQIMADYLAVAINNAYTLAELEKAHAEMLHTKTYEALAATTTQAIHWIGNKALPITTTVERLKAEMEKETIDRASLSEDLDLIDVSARLIVEVKERLLGPAREQKPRAAMAADVVQAAAHLRGVPPEMLTINSTPGTPLVLADTTQLARALGNLFDNSMEAKARNLQVDIFPASEKGFVAIDVCDNGEGIPARMMDKIWVAFITTKGPSHSGLGLPACLEVITQLHGHISVTSQPGVETTFHIVLPECLESPSTRQVTAKKPLTASLALVDDDDLWAHFAINTLGGSAKEIRHIQPGDLEKALKAAPARQPGVLFVDEDLSDVADQAGLVDLLRRAGVLSRSVILSTALNAERAAAYMQAGVKDVVLKPYTASDLWSVLAEALRE